MILSGNAWENYAEKYRIQHRSRQKLRNKRGSQIQLNTDNVVNNEKMSLKMACQWTMLVRSNR